MARNCLRRYYTIGEKRMIEWDIRPNDENDLIIVDKARYEIFKGDEKISESTMQVEDKTVSMLFNATEKGEFLIRIFVTVGPETLSTEIIAQVE